MYSDPIICPLLLYIPVHFLIPPSPLLIGILATFTVWLTGKVAELKNIHRQYQANTIKKRNVLSTLYLDCCVLNKQVLDIKREEFHQALAALQQQFKAQCYA